VVGYKVRWFTRLSTVTRPSSNRARCRATALIETNEVTTTPRRRRGFEFKCKSRDYIGLGIGRGVSLSIGSAPSQSFFIFWSRNAYYGAFSGPFEYLLLQRNTSRSRPPVRLPSLTFQADCGSIKGAGDPAEDGTEHYLPWW